MQEFTRFALNVAYCFAPIHNDFQLFTHGALIFVSHRCMCSSVSLATVNSQGKETIYCIACSYL